MKHVLLFFIVLSFSYMIDAQAMTIAIDAGHGGNDQGTSYDDIKESHLTLNIAKTLINTYKNSSDVKLVLIRNSNKYLSLQQRIDSAKDIKADLFLSLHINSAPVSSIEGIEIYFSEAKYDLTSEAKSDLDRDTAQKSFVQSILNSLEQTAQWKNSLILAKNLKTEILKSGHQDSKTIIKKTPFYVLENNSIPAVLIELGFLSNESDRKNLIDENYQKTLIEQIYKAIVKTTKTLQDKGQSIESTQL